MMTGYVKDLNLRAKAINVVRRESPAGYWINRILLNPDAFPISCFIYAYFRWLDDLVDSPGMPNCTMSTILRSQRQSIVGQFAGQEDERKDLNPYEKMMLLAVHMALRSGYSIEQPILDMLDALELDSLRRYSVATKETLDEISFKLGRAYTDFYWIFTNDPLCPPLPDDVYMLGFGAYQVHMLRDFYEDLSLGYYNVSIEDLSQLNLDNKEGLALADKSSWVEMMAKKALGSLQLGLLSLEHVPNERFRFICYSTSAKYCDYLVNRIYQANFKIPIAFGGYSTLDKCRFLIRGIGATLGRGDSQIVPSP